jgi:hypothetical protein
MPATFRAHFILSFGWPLVVEFEFLYRTLAFAFGAFHVQDFSTALRNLRAERGARSVLIYLA